MIDFWIGQSRKCLILRVPSLLTNMLNIQSILKNKIGEVLIHLEIQLNHIEEIPSFHTLEKNIELTTTEPCSLSSNVTPSLLRSPSHHSPVGPPPLRCPCLRHVEPTCCRCISHIRNLCLAPMKTWKNKSSNQIYSNSNPTVSVSSYSFQKYFISTVISTTPTFHSSNLGMRSASFAHSFFFGVHLRHFWFRIWNHFRRGVRIDASGL